MKEQLNSHDLTAHVIPYGLDDATVIAPSNEQVAWMPLHKMFNTAQFHWKDLSEGAYLWEARVVGRATVKIILNSTVNGHGLNSPGSG
jgi:hypothetical protein